MRASETISLKVEPQQVWLAFSRLYNPGKPTGDGTTNGWTENQISASIWMSTKQSPTRLSGEWGEPVRIKGVDGAAGATPRYCGKWLSNVAYNYDNNVRDIVLCNGIYYMVASKGTVDAGINPEEDYLTNGSLYWTRDTKIQFVATQLILAQQAVIENLVTRMLSTATSGARIEIIGSLISVFGNVGKNIEFGVDATGMAVMKYFDNAGKLLYNLGPKGIDWGSIIQPSFMPIDLILIKSIGVLTHFEVMQIVNTMTTQSTSRYYSYSAGNNPTITPEEREKEKYTYTSQSTLSTKISNGYYCNKQDVFEQYYSSDSGKYIKPDPNGLYPESQGIIDRSPMYTIDIYQYKDGMLINTIRCFFNNYIS